MVCISDVILNLRDYRIVRLNSPPSHTSSVLADSFDVVMIVGALSVGQIPVNVVRELCKSAKPGEKTFYAVYAAVLYCRCV